MATGRGRTGGLTHLKESLNTDLEMMGVGAMFRYHGQMNRASGAPGPRPLDVGVADCLAAAG